MMVPFPRQTFLALAAVYLFAPFVADYLKNNASIIDTNEQSFIKSYLPWGYCILILSVLALVGYLVTTTGSLVFRILSVWLPMIICLVIFYASIMILSGKQFGIDLSTPPTMPFTNTQGDLSRIFWDYIPFLSIISRYRDRHYETGYRRAKESMIVWTLRAFQYIIFGSSLLSGILLCIIIARIATLTANMDFVPLRAKQYISLIISKTPRDIMTHSINLVTQGLLLLSQWKKGSLTDILRAHKGFDIVDYKQHPVWRWRILQAVLIVGMVWVAITNYLVVSGALWYIHTHIHRASWLILILHPLTLIIYGLQLKPLFSYPSLSTVSHRVHHQRSTMIKKNRDETV